MNLPKYYLISNEIIEKIKSSFYQPGMQLPSENEIINHHKVSNTTARKTLQELVNQGWAYRVKGKGTYVKTKNIERSVGKILSFTKNMREAGLAPSTRLLESIILDKDYSDTINGRNYTIKAPLLKIMRLRYGNNTPMMLEVRYISPALCPGIQDVDLQQPLYDIYDQQYHLKLQEVNQMIRATIISDELSFELFDINNPIPAFVVNGVTFTGKEMILEMERSIYRGDLYSFSVRAT